MKNRYIYPVVLILSFLGFVPNAEGQDMNYSQYFSTPVYYNPAFTGIEKGIRARFLFRDQWPTLPVDYKSFFFTADVGDRNMPGAGGMGIMINEDTPGAGLINNFGAAITISARIPITAYITSQIGIKAGIIQRKINWDALVFANQLSPYDGNIYPSTFIPPDINTKVVPDFGAGGVLQFINANGIFSGRIGFAVDHIFQPDVSFLSSGSSLYPRKWVGQFDLIIAAGSGNASTLSEPSSFNEPLKINIGGIYQRQANLNSFQVGLNVLKFNIYLGAWYKTTLSGTVNTAVALVAGYKYTYYEDMSIRFMYSYDLQVSGALNGTGGAHEISLVLEFENLGIFRNRFHQKPMENSPFF